MILAACSPFFQNLLKRNKHPRPLIYMRGVQSLDLLAIIDFLYYGEANVYQENLDSFLAIAEELKLKGLTGQKSSDTLKEDLANAETVNKPVREAEKRTKSYPGNLMHQQYDPSPGNKLVRWQFNKMLEKYKNNELNKGKKKK